MLSSCFLLFIYYGPLIIYTMHSYSTSHQSVRPLKLQAVAYSSLKLSVPRLALVLKRSSVNRVGQRNQVISQALRSLSPAFNSHAGDSLKYCPLDIYSEHRCPLIGLLASHHRLTFPGVPCNHGAFQVGSVLRLQEASFSKTV